MKSVVSGSIMPHLAAYVLGCFLRRSSAASQSHPPGALAIDGMLAPSLD